jgi:pSer/pThr/pTyr-binding forkhead associated (FHA) protein
MAHLLALEALPGQISQPLRIVIASDQDVTLGRTERAQVIVAHPTVTSRHARVWCEAGVWRIQDMESAGGTFINEEAIGYGATATLRPGDVVRLGGFRLRTGEGRPDDVPTLDMAPRRGA